MTKPTWGHMYGCGSCIRKTWIQWFSGPWTERRSQLNQNKMKGLANPGLRCGCTFIVNLPKTQAASTAGWAPKGFGRGEYLKHGIQIFWFCKTKNIFKKTSVHSLYYIQSLVHTAKHPNTSKPKWILKSVPWSLLWGVEMPQTHTPSIPEFPAHRCWWSQSAMTQAPPQKDIWGSKSL